MKVLRVIVMCPEERLAGPASALRQAGVAVHECSSHMELRLLLRDPAYDAVVLDISPLGEHGPVLIADLRRTARLGIVVAGNGLDSQARIRALQSGADLCLPAGIDDRELSHHVLALGRRLAWTDAQTARATPRQWELRDQDWTLAAPTGQEFALSANERILVRELWQMKGRAVTRDRLAEALLQGNGRIRAVGPRSVDVLVSRLRRRIARAGCVLPIRTVYGSGYLFVDE